MTDEEEIERVVYDQEKDLEWPAPNPEPAEEPSHPEATSDDTTPEPDTDSQS